jgi:hypothetical protein
MLDRYALTARVTPAAIVLLPLVVGLSVWVGGAWPQKLLFAGVFWMGLAFLAGEIARDEGKRCEAELWRAWGGRPTTRLLRHSDRTFSPPVRQRYHVKLNALVPTGRLPTIEEERIDPRVADEMYESCVLALLERTRDAKQFPLVLTENIAYGFRRNLYGMKRAAVIVAIVGIVVVVVKLTMDIRAETTELVIIDAAALFLLCLLLAIWSVRVSSTWVKAAADAYAVRLLSSCDAL